MVERQVPLTRVNEGKPTEVFKLFFLFRLRSSFLYLAVIVEPGTTDGCGGVVQLVAHGTPVVGGGGSMLHNQEDQDTG